MFRRRKEKVELPPEAGEISEALSERPTATPMREQAATAAQAPTASGDARIANRTENDTEIEAGGTGEHGGLRASLKRAAKEALVRRTSTMR